ncbi:LuxR family transcriptional regulator [Telmatospirillum sp.]|uniref:LuxR family transcriptional regulator n=1 Tax=Telmatospirillum sp. TaxID=2079197 RepID=UPI0028407A6C|nr:LuxR family transcriptional regulator [Telmatospirillum sp.]MDR3440509.1 LuxR family transcriptional regulator [Telmatospirillum sp.]
MNALLDGFLSRLDATVSVRHTWNETLAFQKSLGFDLMMYGYTCGDPTEAETEVATLSNFPADYQIRYRQERYYRQDPVVHHCVVSLSPLLVGRDAVGFSPDQTLLMTPVQHRIVDEAAACGMRTGIAIPLRSPGRHPIAGMSLSNAMTLGEFKRFIAEWGSVAQLAVLYAHTRMQTQLQPREEEWREIDLTVRERDCLLWASRGLTSKATAIRLRLSPKTVDFHLANAMNKLSAATRIQAVARAVTFGLVTP